MKDLVERFTDLEKQIAAEKGPFSLFALVMREDMPLWDLVISAPWLPPDRGSVLQYLVEQIRHAFGSRQLLELSRIVLLDTESPAVQAFNAAVGTEHVSGEFIDCNLAGLPIKHAYVITSQRLPKPKAAGSKAKKPLRKKGSRAKKKRG